MLIYDFQNKSLKTITNILTKGLPSERIKNIKFVSDTFGDSHFGATGWDTGNYPWQAEIQIHMKEDLTSVDFINTLVHELTHAYTCPETNFIFPIDKEHSLDRVNELVASVSAKISENLYFEHERIIKHVDKIFSKIQDSNPQIVPISEEQFIDMVNKAAEVKSKTTNNGKSKLGFKSE